MLGAVVVVGTVGAPFGVRGWVHVRSFTDPPERLLRYAPWHVAATDAWRQVRSTVRAHGPGLVARFDESPDRDAARALRGWRIGIAAELLPPLATHEHYWRDLVGQRVAHRPSAGGPEQCLGEVTRVFATGAHAVLVVAGADRERMIPFVRQIVVDVDERAGRIAVDWDPAWE